PEVFAAGELHNFQAEARRLLGASSTLQAYDALRTAPDRLDPKALGRAYIESTRPATGRTARFVDKLPRNDLWAPLIHRALPRARLVLTRRNPIDAGYAIYRTLFQSGYHFSYDLEQIGRYLVAQRRLAEALKTALPGDVLLELPYEELVGDPEASVQRLVEHCGLDWRDDLLDFHRRGGAVTTASSHQVRQPFHTESIGRWRAVAEELVPLRRVLEAGGIDPES
ncbi:MAG: sulfotransferase family protein, partial [Gammaproteobacteria bacterium]|nr:sulfotransferase family protein [Gammaproteobacteria bacterium]